MHGQGHSDAPVLSVTQLARVVLRLKRNAIKKKIGLTGGVTSFEARSALLGEVRSNPRLQKMMKAAEMKIPDMERMLTHAK